MYRTTAASALISTTEPRLLSPAHAPSTEGALLHEEVTEVKMNQPGEVRKVRDTVSPPSDWVQRGVSGWTTTPRCFKWRKIKSVSDNREDSGDVLPTMHHTCHVLQVWCSFMWGLRPAEWQSGVTTGPCKSPLPPAAPGANLDDSHRYTLNIASPLYPKACLAFVLTDIFLLIFPSPPLPLSLDLSSLLLFFHSLRCQEVNDTAEQTGCYRNRLVIGQEDWGRVWNDCGWGHGVLG